MRYRPIDIFYYVRKREINSSELLNSSTNSERHYSLETNPRSPSNSPPAMFQNTQAYTYAHARIYLMSVYVRVVRQFEYTCTRRAWRYRARR